MDFSWDEEKAESNKRKHGISFETAMQVFFDPYRIDEYDADHSGYEDRWLTIGCADPKILFVVYTERHETIRVISARRANKDEERNYYNAQGRSR